MWPCGENYTGELGEKSGKRVWQYHLLREHDAELLKVDGGIAIFVHIFDHLRDFLLLRLETERLHGSEKLIGIDGV